MTAASARRVRARGGRARARLSLGACVGGGAARGAAAAHAQLGGFFHMASTYACTSGWSGATLAAILRSLLPASVSPSAQWILARSTKRSAPAAPAGSSVSAWLTASSAGSPLRLRTSAIALCVKRCGLSGSSFAASPKHSTAAGTAPPISSQRWPRTESRPASLCRSSVLLGSARTAYRRFEIADCRSCMRR